jgi:hypothetical protein
MEFAIEAIIGMILQWRIGLAFLVSLVCAIVLVLFVPWFTGGYGVALVILGFGGGMMWELIAQEKNPNSCSDNHK